MKNKGFVIETMPKKKTYESKYVKSGSYVKWQSEPRENLCDECRNRNGKIYHADEIAESYPVHPNCKCKLIQTVAVLTDEIKNLSLLSSLQKAYILGGEEDRSKLIEAAKEYANFDGFLPIKKGRKYYYIKANNTGAYIIFSNDGLRFITYNSFFNIYPIENKEEETKIKQQREGIFIEKFQTEMELYNKNEMAPMAYTYIMKNIYDWYLLDDTAERAMIEGKLEAFRKARYKYTGEPETDKLIEEMPSKPENVDSEEVHYFRNKLNIEYSWEEFEKLNERLPEKYKWEQMPLMGALLHQNTAKLFRTNKKFVSFDGYFEVVYSADNSLLDEVTEPTDMGTYNYSPSTSGESDEEKREAKEYHFWNDMIPYFIYHNSNYQP